MLQQIYALVMDPEKNPLASLPKKVRFQYMLILSYMWSAVFTIWLGSFIVFGPTVLGHTVVLIAVFFTADIFGRARSRAANHRDQMRDPHDGAVLYDDMWGAPTAPRHNA